jgi:hypothetical protein
MKLWIIPVALAFALPGCEQGPKVVQPDPPSKIGVVYKDLPVPSGFTYITNISDASPTGAFRVVHQSLQGPNQRVEVAAKFFKDTYPAQGWTIENEEGPKDGVARFVFAKKDERCKVEIKDDSRTSVIVTLLVNRKD